MKKFFLIAIAMITSLSCFSQSYPKAPYWWIGLSGGLDQTISYDFDKLNDKAPAASFGVGYMMAPQIGVRLSAHKTFA